MTGATKTMRVLVTLIVPRDMTAIQARREVRTLINDQSHYAADPGDVRARKVSGAPIDITRKARKS